MSMEARSSCSSEARNRTRIKLRTRTILKEMGVPDHLIHLLRNLYVEQEATVRTGYGTTDWFKIGKGVRQGCILSPCLFLICRIHHAKGWTGVIPNRN